MNRNPLAFRFAAAVAASVVTFTILQTIAVGYTAVPAQMLSEAHIAKTVVATR